MCRSFAPILFWFALIVASNAHAFIISNLATGQPQIPWTQSASGIRTANGQPATLTWGFVFDGTPVTDGASSLGGSDLVATFNTRFGGNSGVSDLTQQPWFRFFDESFGRWEELSGVNYVYEPNNTFGTLGGTASPGQLGVRPDIRIGGAGIDGSGGTLAFNFVPSSGSDMVLDTDDISFFGNEGGDSVRLRNTITHEIGHGFGLSHVISTSSNLLLEPSIDSSFDGPQLDEVRAVQFFFGDANEKSFGGLGNGTTARATPLGTLATGGTLSVGTDANVPTQRIEADATDFVSISNGNDIDVYSLVVTTPTLLSGRLTPRGGVFNQASQATTGTPQPAPTTFNANARSNLRLDVLGPSGNLLINDLNNGAIGQADTFDDLLLENPGTYFVRIRPTEDNIQLYELVLTGAAFVPPLPGDYNLDGFVDAADYTVWRDALGGTFNAAADGDDNGTIDAVDYQVWRTNFGRSQNLGSLTAATVPEPATLALVALAMTVAGLRPGASRPRLLRSLHRDRLVPSLTA